MSERALLLSDINPAANEVFLGAGYLVDEYEKSVNQAALAGHVQGATVLGVRSGPEVSEEVIDASDTLEAIGCFCAGINHVAMQAAAERGIAVFNAATENSNAVAEHVIGGVFSLLKRTGEHNLSMHDGEWSKTSDATFEVRGKTIGIIGYGTIGRKVSKLAEAVGMKVVYFDTDPKSKPDGGARRAESLDDMLNQADVVTVHVTGGERTKNLIDATAIQAMKEGSYLINAARGTVVDYDAVAEALESGKLGGVAADVFVGEPKREGDRFSHVLQNYSNALLTPHTAGSTIEAQAEIGANVARKLLGYVATGTTVGAVNLPNIDPGPIQGDLRIVSLHQNEPKVMATINEVIAERGYNIVGQELQVKDNLGLVAIDIEGVGDNYDGLDDDLAGIKQIKVNRFLQP